MLAKKQGLVLNGTISDSGTNQLNTGTFHRWSEIKLCALLFSTNSLSDTRSLPNPGDYHDPKTVPSLGSHYEWGRNVTKNNKK